MTLRIDIPSRCSIIKYHKQFSQTLLILLNTPTPYGGINTRCKVKMADGISKVTNSVKCSAATFICVT